MSVLALLPAGAVAAPATGARSAPAVLDARPSATSAELTLAEAGTARLPIVIAADASPAVRTLAGELAGYLKRISGAEFKVAAGDGKSGIVLGTLAQFPRPELSKLLELRGQFDGKEAFAVRSEAGRLSVIGATELGVSHAVYRLVESLGCRWYFPSRSWEIVPQRPLLKVNIDEAERPAVLARRIWYGFGLFTERGAARHPAVTDYNAWASRNRMAQSFSVNNGHAWGNIITAHRKEFEQHPEYLALVRQKDGTLKRQTLDMPLHFLKLNPGEPGLQALVERYVVEYFQKNPARDMVSVEPSDGEGHCECDKCLAMGSISNRVFGLANIAARAVRRAHPGKMVGLYAYNDQSVPPTFELEPNVYVELTAGFNRGQYTFDELKELWSKKSRNLGYYLYLHVWSTGSQDAPQRQGGSNISLLQRYIPDFAERGAASITAESSNNWGLNGRGYYIANRLMWNPRADVPALLDDFYRGAFGAGAAPMQRYWERFDPGNKPILGRHLLAMGLRDVEEASKLAAGDAPVQARLDEIKQYLHYVRLYWDYAQLDPKDKPARKKATVDTLTWAYRTRHAYMAHYMAMLQAWAREASLEFAEPDWHIAVRKAKPWETGEAPTPEETERLFQEDLGYFKPQPVEEKSYSEDLVPVVFPGTGAPFTRPAATAQLYQGGPRYLLYSLGGEPIEVNLKTGRFPAYRDKPPASYVLTDATGKEVVKGRLPLDNADHSLQLEVPRAGLYALEFNDSTSGWQIKAAPGQPATIVLDAARNISHNGVMPPMYFYVPRGTKSIDMFHKGYKYRVLGPDGKEAFAVPTGSGDNFRVPVPAGQDGQVWSFQGLSLGSQHMFNVPNYIAASPGALLVPREVALKDGLAIRN